jgi:hypothetical protein
MNDDNFLVEYTKRANDIIAKYDNYKSMVKDGTVSIPEVNNCLAEFYSISSFLIAEHGRKALELNLLQDSFDQWYSEKYISIKERFNKVDLAAAKWMSKQEIEAYMRVENAVEHRNKKFELITLGSEVSTLQRLCDTYKKMDNIFSTLSNNQRAELKAYSLDNRMNTDYEKNDEPINKTRTRRW